MTAVQLTSMLMISFNKVIIARYTGLSSVSYLEIASRAVTQLRSIFDIGIKAIMPEISRVSVSENAKSKIDSILKKAVGLVFYLGIPVFAVFLLIGHVLLRLWLSSRYAPEIGQAFRIILAGFMVNLLSVPIYYLFMGIGRVGYCFINHLTQLALNVILVLTCIALGIISFYCFVGIYSLSIALSAVLLIGLFFMYAHVQKGQLHEDL